MNTVTNLDAYRHKDSHLTPMIYDIGKTFGYPDVKGLSVPGFKIEPSIPGGRQLDNGYLFRRQPLRELVNHLSWRDGDGVYMQGPTGCGKSSFAYQVCVRLGIPVYEITIDRDTKWDDLVGNFGLVNGETVFMYGVLPLAMGVHGYPGMLVVNELNVASRGVLTGIHEVMCGQPLTIAENGAEEIWPLPGFGVIGTGNGSLVVGDESGQYGVGVQSLALADRFEVIEFDYPSPEEEIQILTGRYKEPALRPVLEKSIEFANKVRELHLGRSNKADALELTMSTRTLIRFIRKWIQFKDADGAVKDSTGKPMPAYQYALEIALTRHGSASTKEALRTIADDVFDTLRIG